MPWLTGERKAVAAAVLAFYSFLFLLVSLQPPPGWAACFVGLTVAYGLGFFSLVSGYFWARWYAMGLGISGVLSAAISLWQIGAEPVLLFYGGTHLAISALLWGTKMSEGFDGKKEWRERFHLDEMTTRRLGKAVIRVGVSLPYVIMYALAPKDQGMAAWLIGLCGLLVAIPAIRALVQLKTWSVFGLVASAALLVTSAALAPMLAPVGGFGVGYALNNWLAAAGAAGFLLLAASPFVRPVLGYLLKR
jgi:hypothetical protein